jgi:hypothetical protein
VKSVCDVKRSFTAKEVLKRILWAREGNEGIGPDFA